MIEKLGITPGPWRLNGSVVFGDIYDKVTNWDGDNPYICDVKYTLNADKIVLFAAPEMLHALINIGLYGALANEHDWPKIQYVIEKATGRSWEEVKKIIEGKENGQPE